jgi:hypothetical protein
MSGGLWLRLAKDQQIEADVDRLIFQTQEPHVKLGGIALDLSIEKVIEIAGRIAFGRAAARIPPTVPLASEPEGFAAAIDLGLPSVGIEAEIAFTYVKLHLQTGERLTAWSFYGGLDVLGCIPFCPALGFSLKFGLMLGQNYLPRPKKKELPYNRWLSDGFGGDVGNILKTDRYWDVAPSDFAAGIRIGLSTTADIGWLLDARVIVVLVLPGPLIMVAGDGYLLGRAMEVDVLIIYDNDDPGIQILAQVKLDYEGIATLKGTVDIYFPFTEPNRWHFRVGTPERRVTAQALKVFDSRSYFMVDSEGLALGIAINFGKRLEIGPVTIFAFASITGRLDIDWEPFAIDAEAHVLGALGIRVFGIGFEVELKADLEILAPNPWYLYAEGSFSIEVDLLFTSFKETITVCFSWGEEAEGPEVKLESIFQEERLLTTSANSVRGYAQLGQGSGGRLLVPPDGVISMFFTRDIEIPGSIGKACFEAFTAPTILDQRADTASNFQRFHAKLKELHILHKEDNSNVEPRFFTWTPTDPSERKRLITRDYDQGFMQFRLNDDPNAWVELVCPEFYRIEDLLWLAPVAYGPIVESPMKLRCATWHSLDVHCSLQVTLAGNPSGGFELDYRDFCAEIDSDGVVLWGSEALYGGDLFVRPGDVLRFAEPSACIRLNYLPAEGEVSADDQEILNNHFLALDEFGQPFDLSTSRVSLGSGGVISCTLNPFDPYGGGFKFSTQLPPQKGISTIQFQTGGWIREVHKGIPGSVGVYPLSALHEIRRRNMDRLQQLAHLEYLFGQAEDPGKLLWPPGEYCVQGTTVYETNRDEEKEKSFQVEFEVVPAFDQRTVIVEQEQAVGGQEGEDSRQEEVAVHPLLPYVKRLAPEGQALAFRHQLPAATFSVNYLHAMLLESNRRLAMVIVDSGNQPVAVTSERITGLDWEALNPRHLSRLLAGAPRLSPIEGPDLGQWLQDQFATVDLGAAPLPWADDEIADTRVQAWRLSRSELRQRATRLVEEWTRWRDDALVGIRELTAERASALAASIGPDTAVEELEAPKSVDEWLAALATPAEPDPAVRLSVAQARKDLEEQLEQEGEHLQSLLDCCEALPECFDAVVLLEHGGQWWLGGVETTVTVLEFRYQPADCPLDVSFLELGDCVEGPLQLQPYERGYFEPQVSDDAAWGGFEPRVQYTARIYALDDGTLLDEDTMAAAPLYSFDFGTSRLRTPAEMAHQLGDTKVLPPVPIDENRVGDVELALEDVGPTPAFAHPADSTVELHMGADLFRQLVDATPPGSVLTPRGIEEAYYSLHDEALKRIAYARDVEHLALERLLAATSVRLSPPSEQGVRVTTLRIGTVDEDTATAELTGTAGVLIEFPEPVDWNRMAVRVCQFHVVVEDGTKLDLLKEPGPIWSCAFSWLRSTDGRRVVLCPLIEKKTAVSTSNYLPRDPAALDRYLVRERTTELEAQPTDPIPRRWPEPPHRNQWGRPVPAKKAEWSWRLEALRLELYFLSENYERVGDVVTSGFRPIAQHRYHEIADGGTGLVGELELGDGDL